MGIVRGFGHFLVAIVSRIVIGLVILFGFAFIIWGLGHLLFGAW
jgi:hypothetical protein